MELFDVYPRYQIEPVKGDGCFVWDINGQKYLDLYGGHAVISIGHSHPVYVKNVGCQLEKLGFYSNSVTLSIQEEFARKLGEVSGYEDYTLFLCNSGAEAVENALKIASFHTGRKKVISFDKGFHGRTSLALEATDNDRILAPVNGTGNVIRVGLNDCEGLIEKLDESVAAVIVEGIQGIAGVYPPSNEFLQLLDRACKEKGALLVLDEVQSGYARTGDFFAHQVAGIRPDIITIGKGMGNGFPLGGVLISPKIDAWMGMLGTTYGGSPMACAAGLAVLETIEKENLGANARKVGSYLIDQLGLIPEIKEVRGRGLMVAIELDQPSKEIRKKLLFEHQVFTGSSDNPYVLRVLPPLSIQKPEIDYFIESLKKALA